MAATATLTMVDGVRVVVPDRLDSITPYVLREQQDWFEDELQFLRRLLQPGETVIDIGANYGVYTLSLAKAVGASGSVLAFEPAAQTARLLAASIAANGFSQIELRQQAVSAAIGSGQLAVGPHAELNALVRDAAPQTAVESVATVTLDHCLSEHRWQSVGFVKIDAEGEERNILKGGRRFFTELSPLVQYEVKAGADLHLDLVQAFSELGYDSYRLVPGLDVLAPFDAAAAPDDYLLNLFCCKPDRAGRLAALGRLLSGKENARPRLADWRRAMAPLPYAAELRGLWEQTMAGGRGAEAAEALSLYWGSRDASAPAADRFAALTASLTRMRALCERDPSRLRLATLARVARAYGARALAVAALAQMDAALQRARQLDASEPFLVPCERFDAIPPAGAPGNWLIAAMLEEYEKLSSYSSFYTGASALPRLQALRNLGFAGPEMQRRLALVEQRLRS